METPSEVKKVNRAAKVRTIVVEETNDSRPSDERAHPEHDVAYGGH